MWTILVGQAIIIALLIGIVMRRDGLGDAIRAMTDVMAALGMQRLDEDEPQTVALEVHANGETGRHAK